MPRITVGDVEKHIRKVEGFKVCVRNPDGSDTRSNMEVKKEYDFINAAPGDWTAEKWRQTRFLPRYRRHWLTVDVLCGDNRVAYGNMKLISVRRTYH